MEPWGHQKHRAALLSSDELFFQRQRIHFPRGRIESHDAAARAVAFEQQAALHSDLHAAATGFEGHLADVKDVP